MLEIVQIDMENMLQNYNYLLHDHASGETAVVDPTTTDVIAAELSKRGWQLSHILNTHHHNDHTAANLDLKRAYNCTIIGPKADEHRIPGIDKCVVEGDIVSIGTSQAQVIDVPGHTTGHNAYYFGAEQALFCGDTMFSMGCGRLFEGTPAMMWISLQKLMALPDETLIYCAHEYTTSNGEFAITVEPKNTALIDRIKQVADLRSKGLPTVPSTLLMEKRTNPFLRPEASSLQITLDMLGADTVDIFARTRELKDNF